MKTVAIIGGGFAGTITAVNLIRYTQVPVRIVLIERAEKKCRGVAYSTQCESHLLNVPAGRMSAFPDEPLHFIKYARAKDPKISESTFVSRKLYGEYLEDILEIARENLPAIVKLETIEDEAISIKLIQGQTKAAIKFASGDVLVADKIVLALGNMRPIAPQGLSEGIVNSPNYQGDPWAFDASELRGLKDDILLIGTGLTMVDKAIEIVQAGFKGNIHAVSRHGLLPMAHAKAPLPAFAQTEINPELCGNLTLLFHTVKNAVRSGSYAQLFDNASTVKMEISDWRQVIDALRPHSQKLWGALSVKEQQRFLRHVRAYWDIHRHRMAPEIAEAIATLIEVGTVQPIAGRLYSVQETNDSLIATITPRGGGLAKQLKVAKILNCTGPSANYNLSRNPLVQSLISRGMMTAHDTGAGIKVSNRGQVLDQREQPSEIIFTLGSPLLGAKGETTAVPELRVQASELSLNLIAALSLNGSDSLASFA
ncbi:MAG: FAD/NAD(P)-binding protein [Leptolyngbya sp.]|nr:FAD/NAD(P)-binding protein [Candidatus Melainabacteria bacterium]